MALVRSAGIRGFRGFVAELGGDALDIANRVGLPPAAMDSGEMLVSDVSVALALEVASTELNCPDFGLRLGSRQDISLLGPLGVVVRHAATLQDAVESVSAYLFAHAEGMRIFTVEDPQGAPGVTALRYDVGPGRPVSVQGTGLVLAFVHRAGMELAGGPYGLRTVDLPHRPPALDEYERHFGVPVRTGRPAALLRVASNLATTPLAGRDDEMRRLAEAMLVRQRIRPGQDVVARVRDLVAQGLNSGAPSLSQVALQMSLHPRTLQRLLRGAGTSFAAVLDDQRRHSARHLLTTTDLSMAEIAREIGFVEVATFSRRARQWWGRSPTQVRRGL